ncbi:Hypothetical protein A7982_01532 [Minicystis rosea]|nr:Hypothetical protein A7982_01532 [Minicystis rosea]
MQKPSLLFGAALSLALLVTGCPPSRYASCQTDADCAGRDVDGGKLICYNLRCLECHYDSDCGEGRVCGMNNTCESLDSRAPEAEGPPPAKTLEECAKRCKGNAACGESCRDQFKNAPK